MIDAEHVKLENGTYLSKDYPFILKIEYHVPKHLGDVHYVDVHYIANNIIRYFNIKEVGFTKKG